MLCFEMGPLHILVWFVTVAAVHCRTAIGNLHDEVIQSREYSDDGHFRRREFLKETRHAKKLHDKENHGEVFRDEEILDNEDGDEELRDERFRDEGFRDEGMRDKEARYEMARGEMARDEIHRGEMVRDERAYGGMGRGEMARDEVYGVENDDNRVIYAGHNDDLEDCAYDEPSSAPTSYRHPPSNTHINRNRMTFASGAVTNDIHVLQTSGRQPKRSEDKQNEDESLKKLRKKMDSLEISKSDDSKPVQLCYPQLAPTAEVIVKFDGEHAVAGRNNELCHLPTSNKGVSHEWINDALPIICDPQYESGLLIHLKNPLTGHIVSGQNNKLCEGRDPKQPLEPTGEHTIIYPTRRVKHSGKHSTKEKIRAGAKRGSVW